HEGPLHQRFATAPVLPQGVGAAKLLSSFLGALADRAVAGQLELILKAPKPRAVVAGVLAHSPFLTAIATHEPEILLDCLR
ncbi:hypothetical protein, partial [Stenotrophomonas maltophilia]|uniref:hypothetical protein n=1 Tax=Stenotrophomonas maltophilia TaxID=40324 RepID=UPI0013DC6F53